MGHADGCLKNNIFNKKFENNNEIEEINTKIKAYNTIIKKENNSIYSINKNIYDHEKEYLNYYEKIKNNDLINNNEDKKNKLNNPVEITNLLQISRFNNRAKKAGGKNILPEVKRNK